MSPSGAAKFTAKGVKNQGRQRLKSSLEPDIKGWVYKEEDSIVLFQINTCLFFTTADKHTHG